MNHLRVAFLCFFTVCSTAVLRAQSCEDSFHAEGSESTGLHLTVQKTFPSMDPYKVIAWLQNQLQVDGRPHGTESYKGSQATLDADVGNHLHFVADKGNKTLTLTLSTAPGKPYDLSRVRKGMCDMVFGSKIDGTAGNTSELASSSASTAPPATQPGQAAAGPPPGTKILKPASTFDAVAAQKAMEYGTSVVKGTACALHKSGNDGGLVGEHGSVVLLATNSKVALIPDTPYAEEAMDLAKKAMKENALVQPVPEFIRFQSGTTTDANGDFQFSKLKPGKYIIASSLSADVHGAKTVDDGVTNYGDYALHNYHTQNNNYAYDDLLLKKVEIKSDGQVITIDLKPDHFDGILGCHAHLIPHKKVDQRQYNTQQSGDAPVQPH